MAKQASHPRKGIVSRQTRETDIQLELQLDGGPLNIDVSPGFFGHMLTTLATYAGWGLKLTVSGDLEVDSHHTVEDTGLVIGEALSQALGDFSGHHRFGSALVPMDEALAQAALDAGRRPYLHFEAQWPQPMTGDFDLCLVEEFWRALTQKAGFTLHLSILRGRNSHHMAEAAFKAVGLAAKEALAYQHNGIISTKGLL